MKDTEQLKKELMERILRGESWYRLNNLCKAGISKCVIKTNSELWPCEGVITEEVISNHELCITKESEYYIESVKVVFNQNMHISRVELEFHYSQTDERSIYFYDYVNLSTTIETAPRSLLPIGNGGNSILVFITDDSINTYHRGNNKGIANETHNFVIDKDEKHVSEICIISYNNKDVEYTTKKYDLKCDMVTQRKEMAHPVHYVYDDNHKELMSFMYKTNDEKIDAPTITLSHYKYTYGSNAYVKNEFRHIENAEEIINSYSGRYIIRNGIELLVAEDFGAPLCKHVTYTYYDKNGNEIQF